MPIVYIIHGPMGANKSPLIKRLAAETSAVHFSIAEGIDRLFSATKLDWLNLDGADTIFQWPADVKLKEYVHVRDT